MQKKKRHQNRLSAVLPVRLRGSDAEGKAFEEIAHTLDITVTGARIAAIRRPLKIRDRVTILYRHYKMEFQVIWTNLMDHHEYHAGLQAVGQDKDAWGMTSADFPADVPCAGGL